MFDLFKPQPTIVVKAETDFIAGKARPAGTYPVTLIRAYLDISTPNERTGSKGGAYNVNFIFKMEDGKEWKVTEYISSGFEKGQSNTYINKKTKDPMYLPGYEKVEAFFQQFTGMGFAAQEGEEKQLKIWVGGEEKVVPRKVFSATENVPMILGVINILEDKYGKPGETVEKNEIDKFFNAEGLTAPEVKAGKKEPEFKLSWEEQNTGKQRDKRKNKDAKAGAPASKGTALFSGAPATDTPASASTGSEMFS